MQWKIPLRLIELSGETPRIFSSMGVGSGFTREGTLTGTVKYVPTIRRDIDRANESWRVWAVALTTIYPKFLTGISADSEEARGIIQLYTWSYQVVVTRGYRAWVDCMKCIKNWCLHYSLCSLSNPPPIDRSVLGFTEDGLEMPWARGELAKLVRKPEYLIRDDSPSHALFQLYLTGKALSAPEEDKAAKAVKQHREDYTRELNLPYLESLAEGFAEEWGAWLKDKIPNAGTINVATHFGPSSSLTSTREMGGKDSDAREHVEPYIRGFTPACSYRVYYSIFGEVKIHLGVLDYITPDDNGVRWVPNKWLYLSPSEIGDGIRNDDLLVRDLALSRLNKRGLISLEPCDMSSIEGYCPFVDLFSEPCAFIEDGPSPRPPPRGVREVKITVVSERGDKARPVNISDWEFTILGHFAREYLYGYIRYDPEIPSLSGESAGPSLMRRFKEHTQALIRQAGETGMTQEIQEEIRSLHLLSLDLSRCSDLITGGLSTAFQVGFYKGTGASRSKFMNLVFLLNSGHRKIVYPGYDVPDIERDNRAPAMGDPPTWWVDNAYTKFVSMLGRSLADANVDLEGFRSPEDFDRYLKGISFRPQWDFTPGFRVRCGDDEVALDTVAHHRGVVGLYRLIGGLVSEGTNTVSPSYGVYCENHVALGPCSSPNDVLVWVDILRIKSLTKPSAPHLHDEGLPLLWTAGLAAQTSIAWFADGSKEHQLCSDLVRHFLFDEIEEAQALGIHCYLPRPLGGLSYPCVGSYAWDRASRSVKEMIIAIASMPLGDLPAPETFRALAELQSIFTMKIVGNPDLEEDRVLTDSFLAAARESGNIQSLDTLSFLTGKSTTEWPCMAWPDYKQPFEVDGVRWLSLLETHRELRDRLITNRGIVAPEESRRGVSNYRASLIFRDLVLKITTSLNDELGGRERPDLPKDGGQLVQLAGQSVLRLTKSYFVRYSLVEEFCPRRRRKISC